MAQKIVITVSFVVIYETSMLSEQDFMIIPDDVFRDWLNNNPQKESNRDMLFANRKNKTS